MRPIKIGFEVIIWVQLTQDKWSFVNMVINL
jgi:hypothetical protein